MKIVPRSLRRAAGGIWRRLVGRDPPRPGLEYWRERVRSLGRRAVLNAGHPPAAYDAVTEAERRAILPHFRRALRGDERLVLDYGCGPGRFTRDLALASGGRAIGMDIVGELLDLAPHDPRVDYMLTVEGEVALPDAHVDVVWSCLTLGGIREPLLGRTVDELRRVLRPGGLVFLVENTDPRPDVAHWAFRPVEAYQRLFAFAQLEHLGDFHDLGERISILAGRAPAAR